VPSASAYIGGVILILLAMLAILLLAFLVVVYVAYPHRGHEVPTAPWVGDLMRRGAERLPILEDDRT
jgi:uncharacterized membrane protein